MHPHTAVASTRRVRRYVPDSTPARTGMRRASALPGPLQALGLLPVLLLIIGLVLRG